MASVLAFLASFALALITGVLAAITGMYLYDRANSKGDDFAVGMGGLFAVGSFTFVVVFTWLQNLHHPISSRTPFYAWLICLAPAVLATLLSLEFDYLGIILLDWLVISLFGLGAMGVSHRMLARSSAEIASSAGMNFGRDRFGS